MHTSDSIIGPLTHFDMPILEAYHFLTRCTLDQIGLHIVVLIISYMVKNTIPKKLVMWHFAVGYRLKNGKHQVKILPWHIIFHMETGLGNLTKQMDRPGIHEPKISSAGTKRSVAVRLSLRQAPMLVEGEANFTYHHIDYNFKLR